MIGPIKNREQLSDHIYYILLYEVHHSFAALLYKPHERIKYMQENNHFPKPKEYLHVHFSSSNFNV
jgi:hypothetical protein